MPSASPANFSHRSTSLADERRAFHSQLLKSGILSVDSHGVASNADKGNRQSLQWAAFIATCLSATAGTDKLVGQSAGNRFEAVCADFLNNTFPRLCAVRPGDWDIYQVRGRQSGVSQFEQYAHLADLDAMTKETPLLRTVLGNGYVVAPDVIVARRPVPDAEFNTPAVFVDNSVATHAPLRAAVQDLPLLHAVVSCKWTLRSDRAQNARTEALNLTRNRKGRVPHMAVITGEPTPSRIASLALGTGDIDCVYHFALYELQAAIQESGHDDSRELLDIMIEGKRLKDISDLPLDLAV
ncbi:MAG: NgoMIV family type II restriction endonuclease [Cellulomonadaceae bacterium]|jgi:hypothetical protein|nr:NgoMIV family type II restriction endonuclease [Cellulomonadaceae bacterium]